MEVMLLSKMEWLAEWFMHLFFDPIYECQTEGIRVYDHYTEVNHIQQDPVSIPSQEFLKKTRKPFEMAVRHLWIIGRSIKRINCHKRFFLSKPWNEVKWHFNQALEKTKGTLNDVQSALYHLKLDLSFQ